MRYLILILVVPFYISCLSTAHKIEDKQKAFRMLKSKSIKIYESENFGLGPCEPSIFINPLNRANIVAGSVLNFYHVSNDYGQTWFTKTLVSPYGVWGDPSIVADHEGHFYYAHLSDPDGTNWSSENILDRIVIQRSDDGGNTWNEGGYTRKSHRKQDKEWLAVDAKSGQLYLTWTEFDRYNSKDPEDKSRILFSTSTDKGDTWSEPIAINELDGNCEDDDQTVEGAVPTVDRNGNVFVAWAYNNKIYFDKSVDNGLTWLEKDVEVASQPGGWSQEIPGLKRCNGMPVTGTDISAGPNSGTIYINWTDQRNGDHNTDVFISKSTDGGKNWSKPKRVNTDTTETHQFFTWMTVDSQTGYIYIVYYDRSNYTDRRTDVTLTASYDGGNTFVSKIISEGPFTPVSPNLFFGDYNNINACNGVVRPIWTHYENSKLSVWTALIDDK